MSTIKYKKVKIVTPTPPSNDDEVQVIETNRLLTREVVSNIVDRRGSNASTMVLRGLGMLEGHSIFLSSVYDWVLVEDDHGIKCLVPLKK